MTRFNIVIDIETKDIKKLLGRLLTLAEKEQLSDAIYRVADKTGEITIRTYEA